jgi:hypothetical protein
MKSILYKERALPSKEGLVVFFPFLSLQRFFSLSYRCKGGGEREREKEKREIRTKKGEQLSLHSYRPNLHNCQIGKKVKEKEKRRG